jgi:hypothetical protein
MWWKRKWLIAALLLTMVVVGSLTGVAFASSDANQSQTDQPTVTAVAPTSGAQGETLDVTIAGTYFTDATAVSFGSGITVNSYDVNSDTQIAANVSITADAATGARDVSVTTAAGTGTLSGGFTVETRQEALLDRVCQIYEENTGTAIDPQQVKAAFDQAMKEERDKALESRLQKLVSEGKITQEQADHYLAWWQARPDVTLPGPGDFGFGGGMERGRGFGDKGGPCSVPDASN